MDIFTRHRNMFASLWASLSKLQAGLLIVASCISLTLLITRIVTRLRYNHAIRTVSASTGKGTLVLPILPYTVPWLGLATTFASTEPGKFWKWLGVRLEGTNVRACTVLLAGMPTHLLLSGKTIKALFRTRKSQADREILNEQTVIGVFDVSKDDYIRLYPKDEAERRAPGEERWNQDSLHSKYLLSADAVNALTAAFMKRWQARLSQDSSVTKTEWCRLDLIAWLQDHMFVASTEAILGSRILQEIPDLMPRFWYFDQTFLSFLYGMPRFLKRKEYNHRDHLIKDMEKWLEKMLEEAGVPDERVLPDWTETFGAKITQARTRLFEHLGLSHRAIASLHLGFLFGLAANAIPCSCWLLYHILSSKDATLLPQILQDLETTRNADGTLDIVKILALPLFNSAFHETLRVYMDNLVAREVKTDMVLDNYHFKKGELLIAPSYVTQRDRAFWNHHHPGSGEKSDESPDAHEWYAQRFLRRDPETGKDVFSTSWASGNFFPFGGGHNICPGRLFARNEVLGAVAIFLTSFDVKDIEITGQNGSGVLGVRNGYTGVGALRSDGEMKVRIRKRSD